MLLNTFCHIKGIGQKSELKFWDMGILTWADWNNSCQAYLSQQAKAEIPEIFDLSLEALQNANANFFVERLPSGETWRIFQTFRKSLAYLDIETTGLGQEAEITTIALYDGKRVRTYVNGCNLDAFINDIMNYSVLVSYNGKSFDIPSIERHFKTRLPQAQIDLRYVLAQLGYRGGLKGCEKQIGIERGTLDGVDGSFAIHLWRHYQHNDDAEMLQTLLAYNVEDTVNLERLLIHAWNRHVAATPFAQAYFLHTPEPPQYVHHASQTCIDQIKQLYYT